MTPLQLPARILVWNKNILWWRWARTWVVLLLAGTLKNSNLNCHSEICDKPGFVPVSRRPGNMTSDFIPPRLGDGSSSSKLNTAFGECSSFQIRIRWRKMHSRSRGKSWFNNEKSWSVTSRGLYQLLLPAVRWKWWHGHSCTAGPLRLMFYWILSPIKVSAEEGQWRGYAGWAQLSRR